MPNPKVGPPVPPSVLAQLPKVVVRALDVSEALRYALIATKHAATYGPVIALSAVGAYLDAAKRQQRRIERARASIRKSHHSLRTTRGSLFDDVHFYLICWARIANLARFIARTTRFTRAGLVLRRYRAELDERIDGRDHLEHFEDRLPGGTKQHKLIVASDLLNMANEYLTYGGRRLDVGLASIRLLTKIVGEFRTALLFDSVECLEGADFNRLSLLVRRAASQVQHARVTKKVQKLMEPTE